MMKKKCLAVILSISIMTGLFTIPATAVNIEDTEATARIPKDVAEIIASFFVRDFQSMPDTVWTSETEIANVVTMYDVDGNVSAYSCELETAGTETGYVKDFMKVADGQNFAGVYVPYGTSAYKISGMHAVSIESLG